MNTGEDERAFQAKLDEHVARQKREAYRALERLRAALSNACREVLVVADKSLLLLDSGTLAAGNVALLGPEEYAGVADLRARVDLLLDEYECWLPSEEQSE